MEVLLSILEWFTYISVSLLMGWVILGYVDDTQKPIISASKNLPMWFAASIPVAAFGNILSLTLTLSNEQSVAQTLFLIVTETRVGQAWFVLLFVSILVALSIYLESHRHIQLGFSVGVLLALSYASHAASQNIWVGLGAHLVHFLTVAVWAGIVFYVGWFVKEDKHWQAFLKWFTPLAVGCVVLAFSTGFLLMWLIVGFDHYVDAWATPYGHALLLKHITIIPLLLFAVINGFLSRKVNQEQHYSPIHWIRAESIVLLLVFLWTGMMTTQSPPIDIEHIATHSTIFPFIYGRPVSLPLEIEVTMISILFLGISLLFALYLIVSFYKKMNSWMSIVCSFLLVFALYISVLTSIRL
ncbi:CopD family protein [Bacillus sp. CGMCC 1.16541]|uniref:copper resistance D family protein n=1 Tax=Bacillus sp. CGMCC 1.16541 TaxID=2185143 RepID=UPI000D73D2F8|nr:CopD family protein [Bacillus sp. CGMCC 1.16541]